MRRHTEHLVLVAGVEIQRPGGYGLVVSVIGRKTTTGTPVESLTPPQPHPPRLIKAEVLGHLR